MKGSWLIFSILAGVLLYVVTVILGGVITPGYNHLRQAISELIQSGAVHKTILEVMFDIYNGLLALGCLVILFRNKGRLPKVVKIGLVLISVGSILGILMGVFPMDPLGSPMTFKGLMHIILAALSSLGSMAAMLMIGVGLKKQPGWDKFFVYTLLSFGVVFISGGLTPLLMAKNIPFMGLLERITIGGYLQWLVTLAIKFYKWQPEKA